MNQSYDDHVKEALDDVNSGQHLRFINYLYRTKEICLIAVEHESTHTSDLNDFYSVPIGNLDYVINHMKQVMKNEQKYLNDIQNIYIEKKEQEKQKGYYGKFENYHDMLNYYKVDNYDDLLREMYNTTFNKK